MTVDVDDGDTRETQFLEARTLRLQKQKTDNLNTANQNHEKREALHSFWSRFRQEIHQWNDRWAALKKCENNDGGESGIDATKAPQSQSSSSSLAEQRIHLRTAFADLRTELDALRKHSLTTTSSAFETATATSAVTKNQYALSLQEWEVPPDLPQTDLRLIHTELTKCATAMEQAKQKLLPKAKFVFHRYRQALLLQQQQTPEEQSASGQQAVTDDIQKTKTRGLLESKKGPLEDREQCWIRVSADEEVTIQPKSIHENNENDPGDNQQREASMMKLSVADESSLVIRNVKDSSITLDNNMKGLHILNVSNTSIQVNSRISGGLHLTGCIHVHLILQSFHQLRMHDSSHLHIRIVQADLSGGIILEDCNNLVFCVCKSTVSKDVPASVEGADGNSNSNQLDIKDFNWLRSGVPSPNFRVEVKRLEDLNVSRTHVMPTDTERTPIYSGGNGVKQAPDISTTTDTESKAFGAAPESALQEDSDDEL